MAVMLGATRSWAAMEERWQHVWSDRRAFLTPSGDAEARPSSYIYVSSPFTTGGLHMGHVRSYAIADAYARFRRASGDAVLFTVGFDAFGLPSETVARARGLSPAEWVDRCRRQMRSEFASLGFSFDWSRSFITSDPDMYKWSQALFLLLHDAGMIYRQTAYVDWCGRCESVLAASQAESGRCWRCDEPVGLTLRPQWYLKISAYNEENTRRLDELPKWNSLALATQQTLLGRIEGVEFDIAVAGRQPLCVFTPFPDSIADAKFVALSPRHREAHAWLADASDGEEVDDLLYRSLRREDREAGNAPVLYTGSLVRIPGVARPVPVVLSPLVDMRYGATAVLGHPELDSADRRIATQLEDLPKSVGVVPSRARGRRPPEIRLATRYRASDFAISRQRAWGVPIPLVECGRCGTVPVTIAELPIEIPPELGAESSGGRLADCEDFVTCTCPRCGGDARRATDTLDCHFDVAWFHMAAAVPRKRRREQLFTHPDLRRWLPTAQFVHGVDTGSCVLCERTVAKALRDLEACTALDSGEPFGAALMHGMVEHNNRKMSKHLSNAVSPSDVIEETSADAVRLAVLYAAAPAKSFSWNQGGVKYADAFLGRLWAYAAPRVAGRATDADADVINAGTRGRRRLRERCRRAVMRTTTALDGLNMHLAVRNVIELVQDTMGFEERVLSVGELTDQDHEAIAVTLQCALRLMAPIVPHIAEELWRHAGHEALIGEARWPQR
jgi:leucyl-tRNA synthetase